jgi:thymidine phosphorylase
MKEIIKAQGGNPNIDPANIKIGQYSYTIHAEHDGFVYDINNAAISRIARIAGAPSDAEAGIYLYKHEGDKVKKGDELLTIYARSKDKLDFAIETLKKIDGFIIRR